MFKTDTIDSCLYIYYNSVEAGYEINYFFNRMNKVKANALKDIKNRKESKIPDDMKDFIHLRKGRGPRTLLAEDDRIQEAVNDKGMHVIASSKDMHTIEAYRIYHARDSIETQYIFMKSEIGLEKYHTGSDESIDGKQFVAFIAGIIRNELTLASKEILEETDHGDWYSVPALIKELADIRIKRLPGNEYTLMMNFGSQANNILTHLGISKKKIEDYVLKKSLQIKGNSF
jgi:hypothetical protein